MFKKFLKRKQWYSFWESPEYRYDARFEGYESIGNQKFIKALSRIDCCFSLINPAKLISIDLLKNDSDDSENLTRTK